MLPLPSSKILPLDFYLRDDVTLIAKELLGKMIFSTMDGVLTGGIIVETEAYRGPDDKACHAYGNRRTARTEVMFYNGGIAYVYLCYGIHHLLNVVTSTQDNPHAILIRALEPTHGIEHMQRRRNKRKRDQTLANGPGALCQALGVTKELNGHAFDHQPLWIEETHFQLYCGRHETWNLDCAKIKATTRIGIDYAQEDALRPWRFILDLHSQTS